ncbi:MAG TPA: DUF4872 domain-containing protein, partial [Agriterribacter sp.]|nr:DUF4872 domain-containing protein [Agriterribacter sp.]
AHHYFPADELMDISKQFTRAGDMWRDAAIQASGIYKGRLTEQHDYNVMGDHLLAIAALEKEAFHDLAATVKKLR